jgi:hypothetical protein
VNVYFALEKVVHQDERKSSAVDILWTKGKLMRQCRTGRDQRYKNGEDNNTYEGDILFTDKVLQAPLRSACTRGLILIGSLSAPCPLVRASCRARRT